MQARYYPSALRSGQAFPSTGRFLSKDPVPYLQRYAYVFNSPTNLVDPSGLSPLGRPTAVAAQELADCAVEASRINDADATICAGLLAKLLALEEALIASLKGLVKDAWDGVQDAWDWAWDAATSLYNAVQDAVVGGLRRTGEALRDALSYCSTRPWECFERFMMVNYGVMIASVSVAVGGVMSFGGIAAAGASAGAAIAVGVVGCTGRTIVVVGGGAVGIRVAASAFEPWHHSGH